MSHAGILSDIYDELRERQTDPRVTLSIDSADQTTVEALGLDSLDMLQLVMDLEDKLGVSLTMEDFQGTSTLTQVAEHIFRLKEEAFKNTR
jgi:acyl carrier protein